jgi:hypothetical protein
MAFWTCVENGCKVFPSKSSKNAEKAMKEASVSIRQTSDTWEIVCTDRPCEIHASRACMLPMIAL